MNYSLPLLIIVSFLHSSSTLAASESPKAQFLRAAYELNTEELKRLVNSGLETRDFIQEALFKATSSSRYGSAPVRWCNSFPQGSDTIIPYLVSLGADVNARNSYSLTPLASAFRHNSNTFIIEALLKEGADPNARVRDGKVALHFSSSPNCGFESDLRNIEAMLNHGADVNAESDLGETPLFANHRRIHSMRRFLEAGANLHHRNKDGQTVGHLIAVYFYVFGTDYRNPDLRDIAIGMVNFYFSECGSYHVRDSFNKRPIDYISKDRTTRREFYKLYQKARKGCRARDDLRALAPTR